MSINDICKKLSVILGSQVTVGRFTDHGIDDISDEELKRLVPSPSIKGKCIRVSTLPNIEIEENSVYGLIQALEKGYNTKVPVERDSHRDKVEDRIRMFFHPEELEKRLAQGTLVYGDLLGDRIFAERYTIEGDLLRIYCGS